MGRTRFMVAALAAVAAWACSTSSVAPGEGGEDDAGPAPTTDATPAPTSDGSRPDGAAPDASGPRDAQADAVEASDASVDASDASADAADAADAAPPPTPVKLGADNVLRGHVHGTFTHSWRGVLRVAAGDVACPAPAPPGTPIVVSNGARCCVWSGAFAATTVASIPLTLDLATRTGTLAGSPIGVYSGPPPDAAGSFRYTRSPSAFHLENGWKATEAIGDLIGESATLVAQSRDYYTLIASGAMREVIMSLSSAEVSWTAPTGVFNIRDTHPITPGTGGRCGDETASATASYLLTSP